MNFHFIDSLTAEKLLSVGKNIFLSSISHPHKKQAFQERGEKRTMNHHLENFHHVTSSWLLASLIGIYSFIWTSFILETYAATPSPLPPQVTNLRGVVLTWSVILAWSPVPASSSYPRVTDYVIRYKLSTKNSYKIFRDGVGTGTHTKVGPLKAGNTYDFRVAAKNKKWIWAYSLPIRITLTKNTKITTTTPVTSSGTPLWTWATSGGEGPTTPVPETSPVDGVCGTSHGQTITSLPTNLCTTGTGSVITSASFSYTWSCAWTNGWITPTCTAYIESTYTYSWFPWTYGSCSLDCGEWSQVRTVTCVRNDGATVADSFCNTAKPATSQSCNIEACTTPIHWVCGPLHGQTLTEAPSLTQASNFCTTGLSSSIASEPSSYTWSCSWTNGGTTANCSASK